MLGNTKPVQRIVQRVWKNGLELRAGDPEIATLAAEMGEIDAHVRVWRQGNGDAEELLSNDWRWPVARSGIACRPGYQANRGAACSDVYASTTFVAATAQRLCGSQ